MGVIEKLSLAVKGVGLRTMLAALRYTRERDRAERRYPRPEPPADPAAWAGPGRAVGATATMRGAELLFERARLRLDFLAPDLLEVTWREPPPGLPLPTREWPAVDVAFRVTEDGWSVGTAAMEVRVAGDGRLRFLEGGFLLREELPPLFAGEAARHLARLAPGERLHGLGERAAPLDLRGGVYRMWNRDPGGAYGPGDDPLYLCVPVYLSWGAGSSYLVFYANAHPAVFDLGRSDPGRAEHVFFGGGLRYYVVPGPAARALERYADLTGKPPLPPLWALGYHQSRWSYYPEARVRRLAADFARHGVPADAIHLDIHYMDGYRVFTVDPRRFPDLGGLARDLVSQGLRLVAILDPGVKRDPGYYLFRDGLERQAFCTRPEGGPVVAPAWPGPCAFPDFTAAPVRKWWGEQYRRLLDLGVAGFWHDMNEPSAFVAQGDPTLPGPARHAAGDHRAAHNLYGLGMAQAGYEGLRRFDPDHRPFIVSRSGWAGLQRYAWAWTGDVRSDWACLRQTIATVIGLGLSGIPFSGSDVGGFSGKTTPELYVRWLQMSAFMPFFRSHTAIGTPDQEPWSYGEPYTTVARDFIRLRYALLPYIYTLAWEASRHGWPPVRPLFWAEDPGASPPGGPEAASAAGPPVDDAFLLGDSLLVAPVTEKGATSREVPVPPGLWFDYWNDQPVRGPARVRLNAPLERIPVLVRAGTVLPAEDPGRSTAGRSWARLFLHLYAPEPGQTRTSRLYLDAGDGYGPSRTDEFRLGERGGRVEFAWTPGAEEDAPSWPYGQVVLVPHWAVPGERALSAAPAGEGTPAREGRESGLLLPGPGTVELEGPRF